MNKVGPKELLAALESEFPSAPAAPWLDLPAVLYALAVAEDGSLDLDARVIEDDGDIAIGPWQINVGKHSNLGVPPAAGASLDAHIRYVRPLVQTLLVQPLESAVNALAKRVQRKERGLKFNAIFDAPLWASISWQYGSDRLVAWAKKTGAHMGEIGFRTWYDAQKFRHADGPAAGTIATVDPGYDRRQATVRSAYATALSWQKALDGLNAASKESGVDFTSSLKDGYLRLAELTGIPSLIAEAKQIGREMDELTALAKQGVTNAVTQQERDVIAALANSEKVFEDSVERAAGRAGASAAMGIVVPLLALGVAVVVITRPTRPASRKRRA